MDTELLKLSEKLEERAAFLEQKFKDPIIEVNRHNIDDIISKNQVVFLFFTADWCGPCISYLSTYRDLAIELAKPRVVFAKVDVDKSADIADRYLIDHIPSIAVIVNSKHVDTLIGSMSKDKLKEKLSSYISLSD
ncbi:MAG: thioredoxin family protein [Desulfurococcales archaeon]|nr:thioredoxin family protein [Desulfurococcales archaeon]MEB3758726.1 thioredoxin family protein [Desulfurococcales archaeon]MEB3759217.1 thioredoxin family protein [Desulfurococcales archaeon]